MPSIALTTFYPGDQTTVIMLDHDHRYLTAFDRPTAANVAHVMVFDSGRRLLSNLKFNCRICNVAADAGSAIPNAIDLLDFGPPPAYEVDRELPDYHEQDQERAERDRPRRRRRSLERGQIVVRLPVEPPRRARSGSPVRRRFRGRQALERAIRRQEVQADIDGRDFQPLVPEVQPAAPAIAMDLQPMNQPEQPEDELEHEPEREPTVESLPSSSPARTPSIQEEQPGITSRDFQPLTPEAQPAVPVIERDFEPSNPTVQPEPEAPAGSPSTNTPVRVPRFSEVFDERHYEALARFTEETRENNGRQG